MKKSILVVASLLFMAIGPLALSGATPYLFYFKRGNDLLLSNYRSNQRYLDSLRSSVRDNRLALRNHRGHYRIVSSVMPQSGVDTLAVNVASIEASVVRAWMVKRHGLSWSNTTFYIDRSSGYENSVVVEYIDSPVSANSSQTIIYTLDRKNRQKAARAVGEYKPIPFLDQDYVAYQNTPNGESQITSPNSGQSSESQSITPKCSATAPSTTPQATTSPSHTNQDGGQLQQPSNKRDNQLSGTGSAQATSQEAVRFYPREVYGEQIGFTPRFGVKSNLLLFAGLHSDFQYYDITPNVEFEYYFLDRWSINGDVAQSLRTLGDSHTVDRFGYQSYGVEPRIWLNRGGEYHGFYAGVYGAYTEFNLMRERVRDGMGYSGDIFSSGLSVGYVQPLWPRVILEAGVRGGFDFTRYNIYKYDSPDFIILDNSTDNSFRLQKVRLSIGYRF